jgi:hypothetical protein
MYSLRRLYPGAWAPLLIAIWCAAIAVAPQPSTKMWLALPAPIAGLMWWSMETPGRWLFPFFICLLLTPPLPFPWGDAGVHAAPSLLLLGLLSSAVRLPQWRPLGSPLLLAFAGFFLALLTSTGFAALYSGAGTALGSLARVALFGTGVFVFLFARSGPREQDNPLDFAQFLFVTGAAAALFACLDYFFQFPTPAGFGAQYVWLDEGMFRRAQGLFYEASTLGNFCAFFLIMTLVAWFRPRVDRPCSKTALATGAIVFSLALILSYSRASIVNVIIGCLALMFLRRAKMGRTLFAAGLGAIVAGMVIRLALPSFAGNYWTRIVTSVQYFWYSPDGVLSGRLTHWEIIRDFLLREPWHAVFGVGYKTLPYSHFVGERVIVDNTWLSLFAETGLFGLGSFLLLNVLILRAGFRAARSGKPRASLFGEWIFCFWAGEIAQMFSGDLITYWRVLPVYFWVLAIAARETEAA